MQTATFSRFPQSSCFLAPTFHSFGRLPLYRTPDLKSGGFFVKNALKPQSEGRIQQYGSNFELQPIQLCSIDQVEIGEDPAVFQKFIGECIGLHPCHGRAAVCQQIHLYYDRVSRLAVRLDLDVRLTLGLVPLPAGSRTYRAPSTS